MFDFGPDYAERVAARDLRCRIGDFVKSRTQPEEEDMRGRRTTEGMGEQGSRPPAKRVSPKKAS